MFYFVYGCLGTFLNQSSGDISSMKFVFPFEILQRKAALPLFIHLEDWIRNYFLSHRQFKKNQTNGGSTYLVAIPHNNCLECEFF